MLREVPEIYKNIKLLPESHASNALINLDALFGRCLSHREEQARSSLKRITWSSEVPLRLSPFIVNCVKMADIAQSIVPSHDEKLLISDKRAIAHAETSRSL